MTDMPDVIYLTDEFVEEMDCPISWVRERHNPRDTRYIRDPGIDLTGVLNGTHVIVPIEPYDSMIRAGGKDQTNYRTWKAMIKAYNEGE